MAAGRLRVVAAVSAVLAACAPSVRDGADSTGATAAPGGSASAASPADAAPLPRDTPRPVPTPMPAPAPAKVGGAPASTPRATSDSVRGTVAVVGSHPMTQVVVRPAGGAPSVTIVGDGAAGLRSVSGADVVVHGTMSGPREFRATSFTVRAVDGLAAADGILERAGDGYALRLRDGTRRPVVRPSPALVAYLGARVWVTGPADVEPQAFGLIER
jgi:hypothetical protein